MSDAGLGLFVTQLRRPAADTKAISSNEAAQIRTGSKEIMSISIVLGCRSREDGLHTLRELLRRSLPCMAWTPRRAFPASSWTQLRVQHTMCTCSKYQSVSLMVAVLVVRFKICMLVSAGDFCTFVVSRQLHWHLRQIARGLCDLLNRCDNNMCLP